MEFSSLVFLFVFLPVFLLLFFFLKKGAHNSFLLIASLVFYTWGEGEFLFLLLLSIVVGKLSPGAAGGQNRTKRNTKIYLHPGHYLQPGTAHLF